MTKRLVNAKQVAEKLGISQRSVWRRLVDMQFGPPCIRLGASVRWDEEALDLWIAGGCKDVRKHGTPTPANCCGKGGVK